jgi:Gram-negative bacterial TonB protein C-terminal
MTVPGTVQSAQMGRVRTSVFTVVVLASALVAAAQTPIPKASAEVPCFKAFHVARGADGKSIVLSTRELDEMATHRVMPAPPRLALMAARIEGSVCMKILIGESGEVKCIAVVHGHPLLITHLPEAVKQWRFRPYRISGRPIAVLGFLDFRFSTSDPGYWSLDYNYHPR